MKLKIHTQIIIAIVLGIIIGLAFPQFAQKLQIIGDLFIKLLKMIIVPLILASMVTGIISIGSSGGLGRIGLRTVTYYLATTVLAVTVGLILVNLISPGSGVDREKLQQTSSDRTESKPEAGKFTQKPPTVDSIVRDMVPDSIVGAMARNEVLGVIIFSLLLGAAINHAGPQAAPLVTLFEAFNTVMMKITAWIMCLAPFGVFALMAQKVGQLGPQVLILLAKYMLTVIAGLTFHAAITLPILLIVFARYSPILFIRKMFSAVATAFSTASSAATLPITMECLEKNVGLSNRVTSFVIPIGATVNMDGTALYEAVAAMFIAQAYGIDLTFPQQLLIVITATLASIGAAAIPSAGLFTMMIVLKALNLPIEGIGMIWAVDRILDMCRTAVNVWGDACGTAIIAKMEGEQFSDNSSATG